MVLFSCCSKNHQTCCFELLEKVLPETKMVLLEEPLWNVCLFSCCWMTDFPWGSLRQLPPKCDLTQVWIANDSLFEFRRFNYGKFVFVNGSVRGTDSGRIGLSDSLQKWFYFLSILSDHNTRYFIKRTAGARKKQAFELGRVVPQVVELSHLNSINPYKSTAASQQGRRVFECNVSHVEW